MNVTVNTDASSVDMYQCGAFAFWIVSDIGKIQKAGELKGKIYGSDHSELAAIGNALHHLKHSKWTGITKIVVNTDSEICIQRLTGVAQTPSHKLKRKVYDEVLFLMLELCLMHGKSIRDVNKFFEFRHVKAHTDKSTHDARKHINDWCDKQAKQYCKQLIKKIKNGYQR